MADEDSIEELEKRALAAKRDALAKRKQIPPFVQKLSRCVAKSFPHCWPNGIDH
jgi:heat shock transcription factor